MFYPVSQSLEYLSSIVEQGLVFLCLFLTGIAEFVLVSLQFCLHLPQHRKLALIEARRNHLRAQQQPCWSQQDVALDRIPGILPPPEEEVVFLF
jgi:hypothetical protein